MPASFFFLLCILVELGDHGKLCSPRHLGRIRNRVQENRAEEGSAKAFFIQAATVDPLGFLLAELAKASRLPQPFSHVLLSTLTISIHSTPSVREGSLDWWDWSHLDFFPFHVVKGFHIREPLTTKQQRI